MVYINSSGNSLYNNTSQYCSVAVVLNYSNNNTITNNTFS